jgi:N6-adenosine-specific RNA methylase IME4
MGKMEDQNMFDDTSDDPFAALRRQRYGCILADPPWQFQNRTGKVAPEHRRLARYGTMGLDEILALPVASLLADTAHLYLWVPNALLPEGLKVMEAWGFQYKSNIIWHKVRKDGGPDGRGVGFYFRNTTEIILFGVRGKNARTKAAGRKQVNIIRTQKREHSRKPDELYDVVEACSAGPYLELFARGPRAGWSVWGDQAEEYEPTWATYANHSGAEKGQAYSANAVVPRGAQSGMAPKSLVESAITARPTPAGVIDPATFIESAVKPVPKGTLAAVDALAAYRAHCAKEGKQPAAPLKFWRALSDTAKEKGASRTEQGGRIVYLGLKLLA